MIFSKIEFLYYFLPITLILYYLAPMPGGSTRVRNLTLLLASLVFYAWGEPVYVFLMAAQCLSAWLFGLWIDKDRVKSKSLMLLSVALTLSGLLFFKYADFFITNSNILTGANIPLFDLPLPIGISFYTFQTMSYTIDLYRGNVEVQRNFFDFSTYVVFFPQLIAGPIVRYSDVAKELGSRVHSLPQFSLGARRFILGLGKKVLLANLLGELVDIYKKSGDSSMLFAWMYLLAYSLHIYFDFSGYSDMAIGLGHIFGFRFPENFNYPYIADSITDFWRRWHITLSSWFRDYVYIPLGGNRVPPLRFSVNILVIWMLTGFWHGADWNFMLWGLYFGVLMLVEKHLLGPILEKAPMIARRLYVFFVLFISWTIFDGQGLADTLRALSCMFGFGGGFGSFGSFASSGSFASAYALYYLRSYGIPLLVGVIGSTPVPKQIAQRPTAQKVFQAAEPFALGLILLASTAFVVDGSFNPFIYFRF
ncbi:MAG: MBOAT family protein [Clostridiales bacterium]|nr:MBOAT family protein [Clostridiales bacterium]